MLHKIGIYLLLPTILGSTKSVHRKSGLLVNGFTLPLISKSAHPFPSMSKGIGNAILSVIPCMKNICEVHDCKSDASIQLLNFSGQPFHFTNTSSFLPCPLL